MATVANLAFVGSSVFPVDYSLCTYNRSVAVAPSGVTTPLFVGEIILDTNAAQLWKAEGATNTTWVEYIAKDGE